MKELTKYARPRIPIRLKNRRAQALGNYAQKQLARVREVVEANPYDLLTKENIQQLIPLSNNEFMQINSGYGISTVNVFSKPQEKEKQEEELMAELDLIIIVEIKEALDPSEDTPNLYNQYSCYQLNPDGSRVSDNTGTVTQMQISENLILPAGTIDIAFKVLGQWVMQVSFDHIYVQITEIKDIYLVCDHDGLAINVAKPWALRKDVDFPSDPSYDYEDETHRTATEDDITEEQYITPDYEVGEYITACPIYNEDVEDDEGEEISWIDINTAGRFWAVGSD